MHFFRKYCSVYLQYECVLFFWQWCGADTFISLHSEGLHRKSEPLWCCVLFQPNKDNRTCTNRKEQRHTFFFLAFQDPSWRGMWEKRRLIELWVMGWINPKQLWFSNLQLEVRLHPQVVNAVFFPYSCSIWYYATGRLCAFILQTRKHWMKLSCGTTENQTHICYRILIVKLIKVSSCRCFNNLRMDELVSLSDTTVPCSYSGFIAYFSWVTSPQGSTGRESR